MRTIIFLFLFDACIECSRHKTLNPADPLKPEQTIMDIRHYTIALNVDPVQQSIDSYTEISLNLSKPAEETVRFLAWTEDPGVTVNNKAASYTHTDDDLVRIAPAQELPAEKYW